MDKQTFVKTHPEYGYNGTIDEIYQNEFSSRLPVNRIYLDHAGTTLYTQSQLDMHFHQLRTLTMGNPHSEQEDSKSLFLINECIELILSILDTSSRDYSLVFTLNTSHACQFLSMIFPFSSRSEYAYMIDSHNSLIGIRQQVKLKGGSFSIIDYPLHIYNEQTDSNHDWSFRCTSRSLCQSIDDQSDDSFYCLFATPAENNFNGLRPPLNRLLEPFFDARKKQINNFPIPVHRTPSDTCHWLTLIDCAKYLSTSSFSLTTYPVDFLVLSFYKIFGYPTGLGALIVRNESLKLLNRNIYFGGGSVEYISPYDNSHVEYKAGINGLIYGTIPFTTILALSYGFELITGRLSYRSISLHTQCLIDYCRNEMRKMKYSNGQNLCLFYGEKNEILQKNDYSYGATLNFNLFYSNGQFISSRLIQRITSDHQIMLRIGTFCAPGASQAYLGSSKSFENLPECKRGIFCGTNGDSDDIVDSGRQPLGSIRLSLGWMSRYEDIQSWLDFLRQIILQGIGIASSQSFLSTINCEHNKEIKLILTNIYLYPIKSCAAISVKEWPITSLSLLYDREWMIIDQNFNPLTLKRLPSLSQIQPTLDLKQNQLILNAKNHSSFIIDIAHDSSIIKSSVKLVDGLICHIYAGEIEQWLTKVLGIYATLARRTDDSRMTLANEGAFLLVYEESVREIRSKLNTTERITHERFRPNLVVDRENIEHFCPAYHEDLWKRLIICNDKLIEFKTIGLCQRCSVVNIDPSTGQNQSRLFTRLQTERREKSSFRANFGILLNLSHENQSTFIHVGDRIQAFE